MPSTILTLLINRRTSITTAIMTGFSVLHVLVAAIALSGTTLALPMNETEAAQSADPCADIAHQVYVVPSKVLACFKLVLFLHFFTLL